MRYKKFLKTVLFCSLLQLLNAQDVPDFTTSWKRHERYTLELIQAMPEKYFGFKPSSESRSFAEIVLHVALANYGFGSMLAAEQVPVKPEILNVQGKSKDQVIDALRGSFTYVKNKVELLTDEALEETLPWGNRYESATKRTKKQILSIIKEHTAHHRGQITVYLRLKAIVPPDFVD